MGDMADWYIEQAEQEFTRTEAELLTIKKENHLMATQPQPNKQKVEKPSLNLILPTQKTTPKSCPSDYKWLIYGPPGIGKTTFSNQFPNPLILDFEGGTTHIEGYVQHCGSFEDVRQVYEALRKEDHQFQTVVFDTVDMLYRLCVTDVCQKNKLEHPSDASYGKGFDMVKNQLLPFIAAFQSLGLGMVFTSHMQEKEIKQRGMSWTKITSSLPNSAANIFIPMADIVGYCHFDEESQKKRMITFKGSDYIDAKARTSSVVQIPEQCELDYQIIASYFKGKGEIENVSKPSI